MAAFLKRSRKHSKALKARAASLPDCMEKRELLNAKDVLPEVLKGYGNLCFEDGRLSDAYEFYAAAKDTEGLDRVKQVAIKEGLSYLLHWLEVRAGHPVSRDEWKQAARNAQESGKITYAQFACQKAGLSAPPAR